MATLDGEEAADPAFITYPPTTTVQLCDTDHKTFYYFIYYAVYDGGK